MDIRAVGTKNAGTTNVKRSVGFWPAAVTAAYDTTKGLLAIALAFHVFDAPEALAYAGGFAAILGHIFPFYLGFRGGKGVATATGMLIVFLAKLGTLLPFSLLAADVSYLGLLALAIYVATRDENFLAVSFLPVLTSLLLLRFPFSPALGLVVALIAFIFVVSAVNMKQLRLFTVKSENVRVWRVMIRPAGIAFPLIGLFTSKGALLELVGTVLLVFLLSDVVRILWKGAESAFEKGLYKAKEKRRVSSMTMFLLGNFLSFLLFSYPVAFASVSFTVFGDMMAKIVGVNYGRRHFGWSEAGGKSVEGTVGFACMTFSAAYFLHSAGLLSTGTGAVGAAAATLAEALPFPVDDNLSVPLLSGAAMSLMALL